LKRAHPRSPVIEVRARIRLPLACLALCAGLTLSASSAAAQTTATDDGTRAAARDLAAEGIDAYQAGDFSTASRKLEKAYRLFATPTLGLWSARASYQLGHWVEAAERFREAQRASAEVGDAATQRQAQKDASDELAALSPRIPGITIELEGTEVDGVVLQLDGVSISTELLGVRRPVNPGKRRVEASRGRARAQAEVQLAEKEHRRVVLRLVEPALSSAAAPAAVTASPTSTPVAVLQPSAASERAGAQEGDPAWVATVAISAVALGGASLAASGITALIALRKCKGGDCASESDQETYDPLRTVSSVTFWTGAALAVGGVATWFLAPHSDSAREPQSVRLNVSPLGVDVRGIF
jgi:hypothetical protein